MQPTIWHVQLAIGIGDTRLGPDPGHPYSPPLENYLELHRGTKRIGRKCGHAVNHCRAMHDIAKGRGQWATAVDWLLARADVTDHDHSQLIEDVFAFCCGTVSQEVTSWPDLFRKLPREQAKRSAVVLFRLLADPGVTLSLSQMTHLLAIVHEHLHDVCAALRIDRTKNELDQRSSCESFQARLKELLHPLLEASNAKDLNSILHRKHEIQKSLNMGIVSHISAPFLPDGYAKFQLPMLFRALELLSSSSPADFVSNVDAARTTIAAQLEAVNACDTYYGRTVLLPVLYRCRDLVQELYDKSDATKPANIVVSLYPKKYPLHANGQTVPLRFLIINKGPGPARDVCIAISIAEDVHPKELSYHVDMIERDTHIAELTVVLGELDGALEYVCEFSWRNSDGSTVEQEFEGVIESQPRNIDWEKVQTSDPYSLEAVRGDRPFIGRESDLRDLISAVVSQGMGSAYIHGQKRVGKTSLAHALARKVAEYNVSHVYLESGDYVETSAEATVQRLGAALCKRIVRLNPSFQHVPVPSFRDSLSPLMEFYSDISEIDPSMRVLIILDEFDELPLDLYKRDAIGNGFFLSLRALSGKQGVGVVLIGGEKMNPILNAQGDKLNKLTPFRLDYFKKDTHWKDFEQLVRFPVNGQIEFAADAVGKLYQWSAGNPYFANTVCREVLRDCVERKDSFVTEIEVEHACWRTVSKAGANSFQHFWEDGILDSGDKIEDISLRRRRILLALSRSLNNGQVPSRTNVMAQPSASPLNQTVVDIELKQFIERGVLTENGSEFRCRVKLFEEWLREKGDELVTLQFTDEEERQRIARQEREAHVSSTEMVTLIDRWGVYRGKRITEDQVRSWLEQFDNDIDRRLMFQLLRQIRFYRQDVIRQKLQEGMALVRRRVMELKRVSERTRRDLLVTGFGGLGKSGTHYARMVVQENKIYHANAMDLDALKRKDALSQSDVRALIVADDILGSGGTAIEGFGDLNEKLGDRLRERDIKVFLIFVCGFSDAREKLEDLVVRSGIKTEICVCDLLTDEDRAFSKTNPAFASEEERNRALNLAITKGMQLEKRAPLGFGDCQALVVFEDSCPNNSLPILWKKTDEWRAIFPRH
jgi:hypothetical protein